MTTWRMRISRCITKATNTHSQYVVLIAFSLQQWLHEGSSLLRYTYIGCLVKILFSFSNRVLWVELYRSLCYVIAVSYFPVISTLRRLVLSQTEECREYRLRAACVTAPLAYKKNDPWNTYVFGSLSLRVLMSYIYIYTYIYIYGAPILDVSRSHTTTQHSR